MRAFLKLLVAVALATTGVMAGILVVPGLDSAALAQKAQGAQGGQEAAPRAQTRRANDRIRASAMLGAEPLQHAKHLVAILPAAIIKAETVVAVEPYKNAP